MFVRVLAFARPIFCAAGLERLEHNSAQTWSDNFPQLWISSAGLSLDFTKIAISHNDTFVKLPASPTGSLSGSILPKTGVFTLTFGNGTGKATTTGSGVFIQPQPIAGGCFLQGTTNSGSIVIYPFP